MLLTADQKLQIVLAGAKTTLNAHGTVAYEDVPLGANLDPTSPKFPQYGTADFDTNGVTVVDVVPAPAAGFVRRILAVHLNNLDTGTITFSLNKYSLSLAASLGVFWKWTAATLYQVQYARESGWKMFTSAGVTE